VADYKTINDTVHGTIRLDPVVRDLMETLELQRLSGIRQLGLTYLVFPGANHSRIEHCLGVSHVAGRIADAAGLAEDEKKLVMAAGLLHDVGHGPFSHTLEHILSSRLAIDHMHLTQAIILGEDDNVRPEERGAFPEVPRVPDVLEEHGVAPKRVAALIRGPPESVTLRTARRDRAGRYLGQIIHSAIDADQIDYLMRDAHYTGAAHGMIDVNRIYQTMGLHDGELAVDRKGLPALEGMLVARALMYSSVYFHKTVRIAEQMIARAVERAGSDVRDVQKMVDAELLQWLGERGEFQRDIALRIKFRKLYKRVWDRGREELADAQRKALSDLADPAHRRRAEDAICKRAGIPPGRAIVDIPLPELLISEPRIAMTDVKVLDGPKVRYFRTVSPLGRALQLRQVSDWVVMVAAEPKHRAAVARAAESVLFA
jgi:HD superfamily phosphohydrolase